MDDRSQEWDIGTAALNSSTGTDHIRNQSPAYAELDLVCNCKREPEWFAKTAAPSPCFRVSIAVCTAECTSIISANMMMNHISMQARGQTSHAAGMNALLVSNTRFVTTMTIDVAGLSKKLA